MPIPPIKPHDIYDRHTAVHELLMQFITSGPDVPESLLQAHEEGRVVFFCGAGISYPAGLPGFEGLVQGLYNKFNPSPGSVHRAAIKSKRYDIAIGLLEADTVGGREIVRGELARILTPTAVTPKAVATHASLLTLGKTRDGRLRLVTTNFDRLFEAEIKRQSLTVGTFGAPLLPVPKRRWDGLVYLHGLLTERPTASDLDRLVASSGDFGLAYLIERWAARFVSEMFRYCTVCFVGYSLDDPVLRYMMDALAADRQQGESPPEMFAFGSYSKGKEAERADEWRAKNVTPILYREREHHRYLHTTLHTWAANYRDGVRGKESIVVQHARSLPAASTKEEDFVGRMLWALSDLSGLPAKRFAEFNPVPALDWLEPLSDRRFVHRDLNRFGIPTDTVADKKLRFALLLRPSPYTKAPWMSLASRGPEASQWDEPMVQLGRWLTRHLDDPKLLLWVAKRGDRLHPQFASLIQWKLEELTRYERDGKLDDLAKILSDAPNAVPRPSLRTLWRLVILGCLKAPERGTGLYGWKDRLLENGLTIALRLEWRELLAPRIAVREPFRTGSETSEPREATRLSDLLDWEIVLATDHVHSALKDITPLPAWSAALPDLFDDTQRLLRDTLDMTRALGGADDRDDRAYWDMPSIAAHPQNRDFQDWTALIEVARDGWLAILERDVVRARSIIEEWWTQRYPTFKRLALFGATRAEIDDARWVVWLLADSGWWLWSVQTQRETMRLLVLRGASLPVESLAALEAGILTGPPRAMFRDDIELERWSELVERTVWLRLAKLVSGGAALSIKARTRLEELSVAHPEWKLADDDRDEFSHWMSEVGDMGAREWYGPRFEKAPRTRRSLVEWLQEERSTQDDWRAVCREKFGAAATALYALARENQWPAERWREALQAWIDEKYLRRSWHFLAPTVQRMPDRVLLAIAHSAAWWLEAAAKVSKEHEGVVLNLCERMLAMDHGDGIENDEPVMRALNHPVGQITQALLHVWFHRSPQDRQGLPEDLKQIFTRLCNTAAEPYRHARLFLAGQAIPLFRVDSEWTKRNVLPLFDWQGSNIEARGAWEGFLLSPRLHRPLLAAMKRAFLETAQHYAELQEYGIQYVTLLTYASLDPADTFSIVELHDATRALPQQGLNEVAQALARGLEGAGDQREAYWANRIQPYWQKIWPKARAFASEPIAAGFARVSIAAGGAFPEALATVRSWLQPLEHPFYVVHLLRDSGLCSKFPKEALELLDRIIDNQPWPPPDLLPCLDAILQARPGSAEEPAYRRLLAYARRAA